MFNPMKAHRTRRVLRRHPNFFDFLTRAAFSSHRWLPRGEFRQQVMQQRSRALVAQERAMSHVDPAARPDTRGAALGRVSRKLCGRDRWRGAASTLIDLPGNGAERIEPAPPDVAGMAAFVRARAAALGIEGPYRLLAMSLGGDGRDRVGGSAIPTKSSASCSSTRACGRYARMAERLRPAAWPALARVAASWTRPMRCERIIHALTCNRRDTIAADVATWAGLRDTAPVERGERPAPAMGRRPLSRAGRAAALPGAAAFVGGRRAGRSGLFGADRARAGARRTRCIRGPATICRTTIPRGPAGRSSRGFAKSTPRDAVRQRIATRRKACCDKPSRKRPYDSCHI